MSSRRLPSGRYTEKIDLSAWRIYLAAFDILVKARAKGDTEMAQAARELMLMQLHDRKPSPVARRLGS